MRSGTVDLILVDYSELMRAEHPTAIASRTCRLSRADLCSSRESSIRPWSLKASLNTAPEVVTAGTASRLRYLPITAIVLVDARLSTGP